MSFKSILKKSLTNGLLQQQLSAPELIVTLLVTVFFAVYILILYRKMTKSTCFSFASASSLLQSVMVFSFSSKPISICPNAILIGFSSFYS